MPPRPAILADAPAITRIYNEGIADRVATFATRARTAAEIEERLCGPHPAVVVLDEAGAVVAFAWSSPCSAREA